MREIHIVGVGQTDVGEHWETSLRHLAVTAVEAAFKDGGFRSPEGGLRSANGSLRYPDAMFVGNMLAGQLSGQEHVAALVADFCGLRGIEAATVEAGGASGGAALRQAYLAVGGGFVDSALAVGVEKISDQVGPGVTAALATASDSDWEAAQGTTPAAIAALIMQRYLHQHGRTASDFAGFSVNAHANARTNPRAMYRNPITPEAFARAPMLSEPVSMLDCAPDADGAAAVLLVAAEAVERLGLQLAHRPVRVAGSAVATDALALHDRPDPLSFRAAHLSGGRALAQAGVAPGDIDVYELHDAFTIFAALSLEALGLAERGQGWRPAHGGEIGLRGRMPLSTFGGLKARGNPGGATGLYQAVEVALQLRGEAGPNQVAGARWGLAQCLGSTGGTAVTHVFEQV